MDLGLSERVYVVTGGPAGLGRATAEALVADGARVVVTGRTRRPSTRPSPTSVSGARRRGRRQRRPGHAGPAGRGRPVDVRPARRGADLRRRPAGGTVLAPPTSDWSAAFESVFLGGLRLGREIGAELGDGGSIAFVLSSSVKSPITGLAISNGLRPGLAMVAKNLADELGPRGVRVNGLLPGRVETDRVAGSTSRPGTPGRAEERRSAAIPLRRYGGRRSSAGRRRSCCRRLRASSPA